MDGIPHTLLRAHEERKNSVIIVFAMAWSFSFMYLAAQSVDEAFCLILLASAPLMLYIRRPMRFNTFHYVLFAMTIWMLIAGFVNMNYAQHPIFYPTAPGKDPVSHIGSGYGLGYTITHVGTWWMVIGYTSRIYTKREMRTFANAYVNVATAICALLLASNCDVMAWGSVDRTSVPFLGIGMNANFFPYLFIPMMVICFLRMFTCFHVRDALRFFAGVLCLFLCRSRGGFAAFALGILLVSIYLFMILRKDRKGWIPLGILIFGWTALLYTLLLLRTQYPDLFEKIFRFGAGAGTRTDLWKEGIGYIQTGKDVVFGKGWGYFYYMHPFDYVALYGYHNFFIQYFCNSGLIVVAIVGAACILYVLRVRDMFGLALLAGQAVHMIVENGFNPVGMIMLVFVYTSVRSAERLPGVSGIARFCFEEGDEERFLSVVARKNPRWIHAITEH